MEPTVARKPRDAEIDVYGLTHPGKVRANNEDQFLLASIHKRVVVQATSLTGAQRLPLEDERLAFLAMVADGVGGLKAGEEASATAVEMVMRYVTESMNCYYRADAGEATFIEELQRAAMGVHEALLARRAGDDFAGKMATTLTLYMGVWPNYYLLQVGDSRYYLHRNGQLTQLSRDQTMAQELVDAGVLTRTAAARTPLANVLSSALGSDQLMPVVTRLRSEWGQLHLLCTDGLTKHVSDEQIAARIETMSSAKQLCEQLLQDALDAGGTDNITIIAGRTPTQPAPP
ncbi:MAG: protein phosphatase 2C domain-containing protein [Gemmatimonadaceae bacterium]|nr:protein phosphatase 2C domain-containing protein [Gemmatimonadaceae bacterium]